MKFLKKLAVFVSILFLLALGAFASIYPNIGNSPSAEDRQRFQSSAEYSKEESGFLNRRPKILDEIPKRFRFSDYLSFLTGEKDQTPKSPLPSVKPDVNEFLKPSKNIKIVWFGHSTTMLNLNGKIILTDPNFSESASPLPFGVKRFQEPALSLSELPPIDYILISHDHYDHLDRKTVQFFKDKKTQFIVPLGVGAELKGWGIDSQNITELDWWKIHPVNGLEFISTPAQHTSGRARVHSNETLWSSWVIRSPQGNLFFSGDGGYDIHFKEIGDKLGPFDVALLECGQYNEKWHEVHLLPDEVVQAFKDLNAKKLFPIHWGMFSLSLDPWYESILQISKRAQANNIPLVTSKLGEIVELNGSYQSFNWAEWIKGEYSI